MCPSRGQECTSGIHTVLNSSQWIYEYRVAYDFPSALVLVFNTLPDSNQYIFLIHPNTTKLNSSCSHVDGSVSTIF